MALTILFQEWHPVPLEGKEVGGRPRDTPRREVLLTSSFLLCHELSCLRPCHLDFQSHLPPLPCPPSRGRRAWTSGHSLRPQGQGAARRGKGTMGGSDGAWLRVHFCFQHKPCPSGPSPDGKAHWPPEPRPEWEPDLVSESPVWGRDQHTHFLLRNTIKSRNGPNCSQVGWKAIILPL